MGTTRLILRPNDGVECEPDIDAVTVNRHQMFKVWRIFPNTIGAGIGLEQVNSFCKVSVLCCLQSTSGASN